ncbi:MAG: glycosyltransferase family 4 protein [Candidatus Omnitrophota bacterium]
MKILNIHCCYVYEGGEESVVASEVQMLRKYGHEVILYQRSNREIDKFPLFKRINLLKNEMIWSKKTYSEIKDIVKKEKPDIAHIHNIFFMVSPSVYSALADCNIPVVQSLHNHRMFCPNKGKFFRDDKICEECFGGNFLPAVFNFCGKGSFFQTLCMVCLLRYHHKKKTFKEKIQTYIAASNYSRNKFINLGLSKNKIAVCPNFVSLERKDNANDKSYGLYIGRLFGYKGIETLFSSYENFSESKVKIIGDGYMYSKLKERAKGRGNIEVLGRLSDQKKFECLRSALFLIFPSEVYEQVPRTVVESFACSVPVIAARVGGMSELVEDGKTGLLFNVKDPKDLASKIEWAWKNPDKMRQMGEEARKEYGRKYSEEKNYEILIGIYKDTLNKYTLQMKDKTQVPREEKLCV